jgi:hypothetical protein
MSGRRPVVVLDFHQQQELPVYGFLYAPKVEVITSTVVITFQHKMDMFGRLIIEGKM